MIQLDEEELNSYLKNQKDIVKNLHGMDNIRKWFRLLEFIRKDTSGEEYFSYYKNERLEEMAYGVYVDLLNDLIEIGVKFPETFPEELDFDYEQKDQTALENETEDTSYSVIVKNEFGKLFYEFFPTLGEFNSFKIEFIDPIKDSLDDNEGWDNVNECCFELDHQLVDLSLVRIELDKEFAPGIQKFEDKIIDAIRDNLLLIKKAAYRSRIPLGAELMDLVEYDSDYLNDEVLLHNSGFKYKGSVDYYNNHLIDLIKELSLQIEDLRDEVKQLREKEK